MNDAPKIFELRPSLNRAVVWRLGTPREPDGSEVEPWRYLDSRLTAASENLVVPVRREGEHADLNMTTHRLWIVTERARNVISSAVPASDVQFVACRASDGTPLYVLNTLNLVDCFDYARSEGIVLHDDPVNTWRMGKVKYAHKWLIDPCRAEGASLFRVRNDDVALLVSSELKQLLQKEQLTGAAFACVSGG